MADQPQDDSELGTAGSADGAPRPLKTDQPNPDEKKSGQPKPQDRPGSNPKNPGDFGHR